MDLVSQDHNCCPQKEATRDAEELQRMAKGNVQGVPYCSQQTSERTTRASAVRCILRRDEAEHGARNQIENGRIRACVTYDIENM